MYHVKDRTLAEDLAQEVYIRIISSIQKNQYCEEGKFLPWALRIAFNSCMDHLRKKNRTSYVPDFSETILGEFSVASPEAKLVQKQAAEQLHTMLDELSAEQKRVVHYRHFEDLSFKEIALRTNTSVNTSLGRMWYALMHLRLKARKNWCAD